MKVSQASRLNYAGNLASLQQKIQSGQLPEELVLRQKQGPMPLNPEVADRMGRGRYLSRLLPTTVAMAGGGVAVGMIAGGSLTPVLHTTNFFMPILAGCAVGGVLGAAIGLSRGQDMSGHVTVEADGQAETQTWKGDPQLRARSPQELNLMLTALGELGENIPPASVSLRGTPDPSILEGLKSDKESLLQLADQRRLVADLGGYSSYGQSALQLVDANAARELAARGTPVFVVNGEKTSDQPHRLRTTAYTGTRNEVTVDDYQYVDRKFDYSLTPLTRLGKADPQASGLPEGILGVYARGGSYTQSVERQCEQGQRMFLDQGLEVQRHSLEKTARIEKPQVAQTNVTNVLAKLTRNSTKGYTICGGMLGAGAAGMLGLDPTAGIIAGGVAGHLMGRVSLGSEPSSAVPKGMRALMMTAGAAVGVGLAVHGGVHASLAVGCLGGALTGAYADAKFGADDRHNIAYGTFMGGSLLGIYAGASAAPWAMIPMALLGGAGGAVLGYLSTH